MANEHASWSPLGNMKVGEQLEAAATSVQERMSTVASAMGPGERKVYDFIVVGGAAPLLCTSDEAYR